VETNAAPSVSNAAPSVSPARTATKREAAPAFSRLTAARPKAKVEHSPPAAATSLRWVPKPHRLLQFSARPQAEPVYAVDTSVEPGRTTEGWLVLAALLNLAVGLLALFVKLALAGGNRLRIRRGFTTTSAP
jgi:hypothetical protein